MRGSFIALLLLLCGCAQVAEISGGERDSQPPLLVAADPPPLSTNFKGSRITLLFNERIQLERVRERMLVSPPLDVPPTVRLSGARSVVIDLNAPLRPNTTYSFGIGEAVKDLTEGNAASGVTLVFSTGEQLDSLALAGRVIHAFTGEAEKGVTVLIHLVDDTATVRTGRPAYATRTDAEGRYLLAHLAPGRYRLHALRDQNANYRYDLPNEEIAFSDSIIEPLPPGASGSVHELRLFKEPALVQRLREPKVMPDGAMRLILERPADQVQVVDVARTGGQLRWTPEWNATRDTVLLWPSDTTALREGAFRISTEDGILDTLRYRPSTPMPFFTALSATLEEEDTGAIIRLRSARPIATIDPQRFELLRDSLPLAFTLERDTLEPRILLLQATMDPGSRMLLRAQPRAVNDIYGGHNDSLTVQLGRAADRGTGTVRVRLQLDPAMEGPLLLQLVDRQGKVLREDLLDPLRPVIVWERIAPGESVLRLIEDRNGNGRWDPGSLDQRLQPERVWRHPERVNVRAAWDLTVDWVLSPRSTGSEIPEP
jgi:hypothetical protein